MYLFILFCLFVRCSLYDLPMGKFSQFSPQFGIHKIKMLFSCADTTIGIRCDRLPDRRWFCLFFSPFFYSFVWNLWAAFAQLLNSRNLKFSEILYWNITEKVVSFSVGENNLQNVSFYLLIEICLFYIWGVLSVDLRKWFIHIARVI